MNIKNIPTIFTYTLSYQSKVKDEVWKYAAANNKRGEILEIVGSDEPIPNELKSKFRNGGFIREKVSKYYLKRCAVSINGGEKVEDIKQN